jgi:sialate O-acetylesterase
MKTRLGLLLALGFSLAAAARAELKLPAIIGDHMVLQQKQANPIWGWDTPGTKVSVTFAGQTQTATAGADGKWTVKLAAAPANATPQVMAIAGTTKLEIQDILIGEVWMCSGQSNMGFKLQSDWNGDLEAAASNLPNLRLISVPLTGTQELKTDFKGQWRASTPANAKVFTAVGFLFGRYIHEILNVPVGLIDNSWGGSAAEAWVRRETIESDARFKALMESTKKREATLEADAASGKAKTDQDLAMEKWKATAGKAKAEGRTAPVAPVSPQSWLTGNARPGNIFAGMVHPTLGYGLKGVIWYQGESNAGRAFEHADLFPFLIEQWRKEWGQGDFSFYWVQLADFRPEKPAPGESDWAELRETQTKTQKLANTGQAVIIDLGEGKDIHPRNKHDVAARLVRWALVKDYGLTMPYHSPEYKSVQFEGNKAMVTLDCFGSTLRAFDVANAVGFAVCGEDKVWRWASGKVIAPNKVEVWSDEVPQPIAVRYAWADNPVCNLFSNDGLPVTPFRTDDFEMTTKPKPAAPAAAVPPPPVPGPAPMKQ